MAEIGHILELSELVRNFSVSGSPFDVISELYTYTVGGYFVSFFFFFFSFYNTQTPADCSFVFILFYRFKKKHKKICIQVLFFPRFTHCRYFAFQPPSQPAWRERDVSLSLFILSFHSPRWLLIKEGRRWKNIRDTLDDLIM